MTDLTSIPTWPELRAITRADGTGELVTNGVSEPIDADNDTDARNEVIRRVTDVAVKVGRPVRLIAEGPDGTWPLIIHENGHVDADPDTPPTPPSKPVQEPSAPAAPQIDTTASAAPTAIAAPPAPTVPAYVAAAAPSAEPISGESASTRRERRSFLSQQRVEKPATQGVRGALARVGIRIAPGTAELAERDDVRAVSQHFAGPKTIAIVNGKGGASKTLTTICLSAVFARYGGAGVLAWDNNQTRGTLGWSTEQGGHDSSILDVLPRVDELLGTGAQSADLARYVHHQSADKFDVLRSKPDVLADQQRFDAHTVDAIHAVATKFYRLVFIDSGNDETDPMWVRAVEHADQIVVPTIGEARHAESAALLLEGLADRGGKFATLAQTAVAVVSKHRHDLSDSEVRSIAEGFQGLARDVVSIPYDPSLGADMISYESMRPATRRAWLAAGAAVARGL